MNTAILESWMRVEAGQLLEEATFGMHLGEGPQRLGFEQRERGFGLSVGQGGAWTGMALLVSCAGLELGEGAGLHREMGVACRRHT